MIEPAALLFLVLTNAIGGSSYLFTDWALEGLPAGTIAFARTFLGLLVMAPFVLPRLRPRDLTRRDLALCAGVGICGYALPILLNLWGQRISTASNAALLLGVEPISIVLLSALFLGEGLNTRKIAAIVAGVVGSMLVALQGVPFLGARITPHFTGDLLLVAHGIAWSLYSILGKPVLARVDPLRVAFLAIAFATPVLAVPAAFDLAAGAVDWPAVTPRAAWSIPYLGVIVTAGGLLTWNLGLRRVPASTVAAFLFLQPVFGAALGVLIEGDDLSRPTLAGGALILAGMVLAARETARPRSPRPASPASQETLPSQPLARDEDPPRGRAGAG